MAAQRRKRREHAAPRPSTPLATPGTEGRPLSHQHLPETGGVAAGPAAAANNRLHQLRRWWLAVSERERRLLTGAGVLLAVALLWFVALQPAWRTLKEAPAEKARLDAQLTEMRSLAQEATQLRTAPLLAPEQATAALKSVTERLGPKAKLALQGERAVITFEDLSPAQLGPWLEDARAGARARPIEANLSRSAAGFNGTVVLSVGGKP